MTEVCPHCGGPVLVPTPRCNCPIGFGQVVAHDCPVHNPPVHTARPAHTISLPPSKAHA